MYMDYLYIFFAICIGSRHLMTISSVTSKAGSSGNCQRLLKSYNQEVKGIGSLQH